MSVSVTLVDGPLPAHQSLSAPAASRGAACQVGASTMFEGIVRASEDERPIIALDYEAYNPMATRMLERIARELVERHKLHSIEVQHSTGRVGVGERSFRLIIDSAHRAEGIAATSEFIDRMKRDVPIWKRAVSD